MQTMTLNERIVKATTEVTRLRWGAVVSLVPNPDFGQSFAPNTVRFTARSLKSLKAKLAEFRDYGEMFPGCGTGIGGGNWSCSLWLDGVKHGRVSYNGRVWDLNENEL